MMAAITDELRQIKADFADPAAPRSSTPRARSSPRS